MKTLKNMIANCWNITDTKKLEKVFASCAEAADQSGLSIFEIIDETEAAAECAGMSVIEYLYEIEVL